MRSFRKLRRFWYHVPYGNTAFVQTPGWGTLHDLTLAPCDLTLARVEPFPRAKARKLVDLAAQHELMPAFDRRPITLALIARESVAHKSILGPSLADSHI